MNTLDDLRRTLDHHAHDVHDDVIHSRTAAVRGRAVAVRRRRAAGVATAAALAVIGAVGVPQLVSDVDPGFADRQLLGRTAPETMSALGYTYAFARGTDSRDGASTLELEPSDEPRLVTWAATGPVRVVEPDDVEVSDRVEFDDWAYVPPGAEGTWTVRADATAIAVYELTDDRPAGVTRDGITYREQVGDEVLLGAEVGEVGQDEVSVTYTVPEGDTRWAPLCLGGTPRGTWLHVDLGERRGGLLSGPACDDSSFDPGGWGGSSGPHGRTGGTLTASVYLTDGPKGPRVDLDDVRLGLGVYAVEESGETVVGETVPEVLEHDGHLWRFDGSVSERPGTTSSAYRNTSEVTELVWVTSSGPLRSGYRVDFGSGDGALRLQGGGGTWDTVIPGDHVRVSARDAVESGLRIGYAWYTRAD